MVIQIAKKIVKKTRTKPAEIPSAKKNISEDQDIISIKKDLREIFLLKPLQLIILVIILTILFTLTGIWQLVIISGFFGGFLSKRAKHGGLIGFIGVFFGWMILFIYYALTTEMIRFFEFWINQTMGLNTELLYLIMIVCSLAGGFFGGLGGINGAFISQIFIENLGKSKRFKRCEFN